MDALIFDFDGVVVDSEPIHYVSFKHVLASRGLELSEEDYYERYLGYDDHDCFRAAALDRGCALSEKDIAAMTAEKTALVQKGFETVRPLPGAVELIRSAAGAGLPLAVCSGALRAEIEIAARQVGVIDCFRLIVAAKDVVHGKPDPEGYVLALRGLAEATGRELRAAGTVVIEDSPAGIDAAKGAGMRVLAVTNSYPADALTAADRVVDSLADATCDELELLARN